MNEAAFAWSVIDSGQLAFSVRKSAKKDLFPIRMLWLMISAKGSVTGINSCFIMACIFTSLLNS